jgi:hypothetical protein
MVAEIHGDIDRIMPHLLLHKDGTMAIAKEKARVGVPYIVEPDIPEASFRENPFERSANEIPLQVLPVAVK